VLFFPLAITKKCIKLNHEVMMLLKLMFTRVFMNVSYIKKFAIMVGMIFEGSHIPF